MEEIWEKPLPKEHKYQCMLIAQGLEKAMHYPFKVVPDSRIQVKMQHQMKLFNERYMHRNPNARIITLESYLYGKKWGWVSRMNYQGQVAI